MSRRYLIAASLEHEDAAWFVFDTKDSKGSATDWRGAEDIRRNLEGAASASTDDAKTWNPKAGGY